MACQDLAGTAMPADFDWFEYRERGTSPPSRPDDHAIWRRRGCADGRWRAVLAVTAATVGLTPLLPAQEAVPIYRQASAPLEARVTDLLARMTLDEKVAQLLGVWNRSGNSGPAGAFDPASAEALLGDGIGQISRPSEIARPPRPAREHAARARAVRQRRPEVAVENTRLGIPAMFHDEALHGLAAPRGTHFPVPIGLASTWDPALVERVMSVAAREARARGSQHVLSPVVDLGRDPRWGRIEETYGEDPYLVTQMGVAAVRGYQGRRCRSPPTRCSPR